VLLRGRQLQLQRARDAARHVVLHLEDVVERRVDLPRPERPPVGRLHDAHRGAQA
jgi:hypothetical protein